MIKSAPTLDTRSKPGMSKSKNNKRGPVQLVQNMSAPKANPIKIW